MTFDIALNRKTHDLALVKDKNGLLDLVLIDNAEGVAQGIKMTLLLFLGEWFLDTSAGIPYQAEILTKNPDMSTVRARLSAAIAGVPHVIAVQSISLQSIDDSRQLQVNWAAYTDYGYINRSTVISGGNT